MTEIPLPCCDRIVLVESLEAPIHCDDCGLDLELADDAPVAAPAALAA